MELFDTTEYDVFEYPVCTYILISGIHSFVNVIFLWTMKNNRPSILVCIHPV